MDKETGDGVDGRAEMQVRFGVMGIHSKKGTVEDFLGMTSEWPKSWLIADREKASQVCIGTIVSHYKDPL